MKKKLRNSAKLILIHCSVLFALVLAGSVFSAVWRQPLVLRGENIYQGTDAYDDFSREQGDEGWYYFSVATSNGQREELYAGETDRYGKAGIDGSWIEKSSQAEIGMHPALSYGVEMSYKMPQEGLVDIQGELRRLAQGWTTVVSFRILLNETQIFPSEGALKLKDVAPTTTYACPSVAVKKDDMIRFVICHDGVKGDEMQDESVYWGTETRVKVDIDLLQEDETPEVSDIVFHRNDMIVEMRHDGQNFLLSPVVLPSNAINKTLTYVSGNPSIATVAEDGTVTLLSEGTVTVTAASASNPFVSAHIVLRVKRGIEALHSHSFLDEYSALNGGNGWHCLYEMTGEEGDYHEMRYESGSYIGDEWATVWKMPDTIAIHPGSDRNAVVGYRIPVSGVITINDTAYKMPNGDGVRIRILLDNRIVFPSSQSWLHVQPDSAMQISLDGLNVERGQMLYFVVNKNEDIGFSELQWSPTVHYMEDFSPSCFNSEQDFIYADYVPFGDMNFQIQIHDRAFASFTHNDEAVDPSYYRFNAENGVLTLDKSYLTTLTEETHPFEFSTEAGSCTLFIKVINKNPTAVQNYRTYILTDKREVSFELDLKGGVFTELSYRQQTLSSPAQFVFSDNVLTLKTAYLDELAAESSLLPFEFKTKVGKFSLYVAVEADALPMISGLQSGLYDKAEGGDAAFRVRLKDQEVIGIRLEGAVLAQHHYHVERNGIDGETLFIHQECLLNLSVGQYRLALETEGGSVAVQISMIDTAPAFDTAEYWFDLKNPSDIRVHIDLSGYELLGIQLNGTTFGHYDYKDAILTIDQDNFLSEKGERLAFTAQTERGESMFYVNVIDSTPMLEGENMIWYQGASDANCYVRVVLYDQSVTSVTIGNNTVPKTYYSYDGHHLLFSEDYMMTLQNGTYTAQVSTASGNVEFHLSVNGNVMPPDANKGCKSDIAATASMSAIFACAVIFAFWFRRHSQIMDDERK